MVGLREPLGADVVKSLVSKLRSLGLHGKEELQAVLCLLKTTRVVNRGADIVRPGDRQKSLTVLLAGVACRYRMMDNGRRQIFTFEYPGDTCDYHRYVLQQRDDPVAAVIDCFVGVIGYGDLERICEQYPQVGLVFRRAMVLEARIFLERVINGAHRPARERIANILCEQLLRLERSGMAGDVIPLTQVDLADTAGLSVVHVNRTIQELRELGALSKRSHSIKVENRHKLIQVARFDGTYLDVGQVARG
jgi:CRP-like cAMP-binding protein